jgi:uncharacterized protein YcfL
MKTAPFLLFVSLLASCAPANLRPVLTAAAQQKQPDPRVILDESVRGNLRILAVRATTGSDGLLKFQVDVQKIGPAARTFLYQVDWFDRDGVKMDLGGDPLPWTLLGNESDALTMTAPSPLAKDFHLTFRLRPK